MRCEERILYSVYLDNEFFMDCVEAELKFCF